ncbi:MAG: thioredoxin family protein [bacterium]|nr:thioredoxin family protein [bacterium]
MKTWFSGSYIASIILSLIPTMLFAAEIIIDNSDSTCFVTPAYSWQTSVWGDVYGADKLYTTKSDIVKSVRWRAQLNPGRYRVFAWVNPASYASDAKYTIYYGQNSVTLIRNQTTAEGKWSIDLGVYDFDTVGEVVLTNEWQGPEQFIVADAIKFVEVSTTEFSWSAKTPADALAMAKSSGKAILLFFSTEKATDAQKLLAETLTDPTVVKWGMQFITVHIQVDKNPELAEPYGIYRVPVIIFQDYSGKEIHRIEQFISAAELVQEMNKALAKNVPPVR